MVVRKSVTRIIKMIVKFWLFFCGAIDARVRVKY